MWWFLSPKIVFGEDALDYLSEVEVSRVFIVTDKVVSKLGFVNLVISRLQKPETDVHIFDDVEPEPSVETCQKGAEIMREFGPDAIIALGGGSCIDAAKAMWILYERPEISLEAVNPFDKLGLRQKAKLIAIPTTSGTGSEVTWAAVITNVQEHRKMAFANRELIPDIAIVDPALPLAMPPQLTAYTGLDVLTHAIEGFTVSWKNDFSDGLALKAILLVFRYLSLAVKNGSNKEAREKMHNAATLAGLAFSNSQVGIAHSLGHSIGAIFKVPHGRAVGLMLPFAIEYNSKHILARYAEIARILGFVGNDETLVKDLVLCIRNLSKSIGEPLAMKEIGITRELLETELERLVLHANQDNCTVTNPRVPSDEELRKLFIYAYEGKSIDF